MKYNIMLPVIIILTLIFLLPVTVPVYCTADEVVWPVKCYEGDDLQKVREWEKTWAGKRIDINNVAGVKEFLLDTYYEMFTDPSWGGDYWFEILPYTQTLPSPGDVALTKKYAPQCKVGENDQLLNYVSGYPFPNPKSAIEIAYNFNNINSGDTMWSLTHAWLIDGRRKYNRSMILDGRIMWFSGRREVAPVPEMQPNTKNIYRASHSEYVAPASLKGNHSMSINWKDRTKPWASWSFASATRRVTRRSTAQRQSSLGGTDVIYNDDWGYSWAIPANTYKMLGRKELLACRHQDIDQLVKEGREGYCLQSGMQRERINVYVIEAQWKEPGYIYSKDVWYMDPETWWILFSEKYDKRGKYWKYLEIANYLIEMENNGPKIPHMGYQGVIDVQRKHATATPAANVKLGATGKPYWVPEYFEPRALLKHGY